jgi:hypothetical protein
MPAPDKKISEMTVATTVDGFESVPVVKAGANFSMSAGLVGSCRRRRPATVTGVTTLDAQYDYIRVDTTSGAFALTLPLASAMPNRMLVIKKINTAVNACTVTRAGSDLIDGATTVTVSASYARLVLFSTGTTWDILNT